MWGTLLVLALLLTVNPVRLGIMLLVLSRPRPMPNLFAYWVGTLLAGLGYLIVPLILLHSTPTLASFARRFVQSEPDPVGQAVMIGLGALLLVLGAVIATRSLAKVSGGGGTTSGRHAAANTSDVTFDPSTLPIVSRLTRPEPADSAPGTTRTRRTLSRATEAWQNGSPWIAFAIGLMVMPADGVLLALAVIVASGAPIGMQLGAAIVFVFIVLAVEELLLVSNLVVPDKTQAALRRLHDWAVAHHRKFMAAILGVVGISLIIQGMGGF